LANWDDVRGNLVDWYTLAAERTGDWARLGVHQVDRYGIQRRRERLLQELGALAHRLLTSPDPADLEQSPEVREILARLEALDTELADKDDQIAAARRREGPPDPPPASPG